MSNYQVNEIETGRYNGTAGRFFKLYRFEETVSGLPGAWIHQGNFFAPRRVAKKNLVQFALDQLNEEAF